MNLQEVAQYNRSHKFRKIIANLQVKTKIKMVSFLIAVLIYIYIVCVE